MIPTDEVHHFFRGVQTTNQYYVLWIIPSGKHIQKAIEHSRNSGLTMIYPLKKVDLSIVFCMLKPFRVTDVSRDKLAKFSLV